LGLAIVFVSKDENLTKAHVRYLESRILAEAAKINKFKLEQNQAGGAKLPESDLEDMEVFQAHVRQFLPVLGSDILAPIAQSATEMQPGGVLLWLIADGVLIEKDGFFIFTRDTEFSSPSAAAAVIFGRSANGLVAWKTESGKSLKQLDEQT